MEVGCSYNPRLCSARFHDVKARGAAANSLPVLPSNLLTYHTMALSASFPRSAPTSQLQQQARSPSSLQSSLPPSQSPSSSSFLTSASSPPSSPQPPQGMVGNDRLDPTRLTLNNGINHGDYIIGPLIQPVNGTPVRNISEYIAKRDGTDEFVVLKVLTLNGSSNSGGGGSDSSEQNEDQGRMLLYNELSILSLLQDQPGVVHQHGFFREKNYVILVLDCLVGHEYDKDGRYKHFENLQHYVIREKKLCEREALEVFGSALATVDALHQVSRERVTLSVEDETGEMLCFSGKLTTCISVILAYP